jgi:hypothetical protein
MAKLEGNLKVWEMYNDSSKNQLVSMNGRVCYFEITNVSENRIHLTYIIFVAY